MMMNGGQTVDSDCGVFRCALPGETEDKKQNAVRIASTLADT
jgi:hypothetical protein